MEGDIPRIETDEDAANGERMGVISEEAETEVDKSNRIKENEAVVDGVDKVNIADKIKAKMENVRDNVRIPTRCDFLKMSSSDQDCLILGRKRRRKTRREE